MYEKSFGLWKRPFAAAPSADFFFPSEKAEDARKTLTRCVERAEGPGMLIGPPGSGKTLLCQVLARQFRGMFRLVMLSSTRLVTRRALLQNILFELGLPYRDLEEGELRLSLIDFLDPSELCPSGMLLIVDEAHTLPLRLLEEIRMLTNLVRDGQPRVRLMLAGGALLEERFANPKLESFQQRVAARCYLQAFSRAETLEYVRAQTRAAGGDPAKIFGDDALHAIHMATDGVPRLINQVCDHALILAALGRRGRIERAGIDEAWADLQQLPAPWQADEESGAARVEFGALSAERAAGSEAASAVGAIRVRAPAAAVFDEAALPLTPTVPLAAPAAPVAGEASASEAASRDPAASPEKTPATDSATRSRAPRVETTPPAPRRVEAAPATNPAAEDYLFNDFAPRFGAGPEVELVFHGPHNPFAEPFEKEELILDRYTLLESKAAWKPHFREAGESELAPVLAHAKVKTPPAHAAETPAAKAALQPPRAPASSAHEPIAREPVGAADLDPHTTIVESGALDPGRAGVMESWITPPTEFAVASLEIRAESPRVDDHDLDADWTGFHDSRGDALEANHDGPGFADLGGDQHDFAGGAEPVLAREQAAGNDAADEALADDDEPVTRIPFRLPDVDDRDMIVVDDEVETRETPAGGKRAKRQEYRQLFARLRKS